jgi:hypothetical protein
MTITESFSNPESLRWREVAGPWSQVHFVRHDYTVLAHDAAAGTLDMLVRWRDDGGHCPLHRHTATTTSVLVLAGEQHVCDILPDGTLGPLTVRTTGQHVLLPNDRYPHLECGAPDGGLAFFGCHTADGRLYDIIGDDGELLMEITIENLVADFEANATGPSHT